MDALDLIACIWQEYVDATSKDEPSEHRWRILRNAHASSALPGMGVTLDEVVAYTYGRAVVEAEETVPEP